MKGRGAKVHGIGHIVEIFTRVGLSAKDLPERAPLAQSVAAGRRITREQYAANPQRAARPSGRAMAALANVAASAVGAHVEGTPDVHAARVSLRARKQVRLGRFFLSEQHDPQGIHYVDIERPEKTMPDLAMAWSEHSEGAMHYYLSGVWLHGRWGSAQTPLLMTVVRKSWEDEVVTIDILKIGETTGGAMPSERDGGKLCDTLIDRCEPIIAALLIDGRSHAFNTEKAHAAGQHLIETRQARLSEARAEARRSGTLTQVEGFDGFDRRRSAPDTGIEAIIESARWIARLEGHNLRGHPREAAPGGNEGAGQGLLIWIAKLRSRTKTHTDNAPNDPNDDCGATQVVGSVVLHALQIVAGENHGGRDMHALLVPRRLRNAIDDASRNEHAIESAQREIDIANWYIENEAPRTREPRAITIGTGMHATEGKTHWALGIWTSGARASPSAPFVVTTLWCNDGRAMISGAQLGENPERFDVGDTDHELLTERGVALADATDVAYAAIAHHCAIGRDATLRGAPGHRPWRPNASSGHPRTKHVTSAPPAEIAMFAIARAPDPDRQARDADTEPTRKGSPHEGRRVKERHWVEAHSKWQPWGKGSKLRKLIEVGRYERGPEPGPDQILMTRLPRASEPCT